MSYRKFQIYFFILLLVASAVFTLLVLRPYLVPLAFGGVLAVVSRPMFKYLRRVLRSDSAAAFLTILSATLIFLVPTAYFLAALTHELGTLFSGVRSHLEAASLTALVSRILPLSLQAQVPQVVDQAVKVAGLIAQRLTSDLVGFFSNAFGVIIGLVVMLISAYYLLKDGAAVKKELLALSPLSDEDDEIIFQRLVQSVGAVMSGMLIIGLLKGVLAGLSFWIFGVPAPLFWGAMTGLAFFIPLVGSALVTVPAVIYLAASGHVVSAVGLAVVAAAVIGTVDNLIQPKLVQSKTNIHPLLVLLSIVGGIEFFGFVGFILGPLVLTVTLALIDIYRKEFKTAVEKMT